MARRVAAFLGAFLVICGGLVLLPALDLRTSALFTAPGRGFFLADWAPFRLVHAGVPVLVAAIILAAAARIAAAAWRGRDARAAIFLLISLAVGPGLVVNTVFKDHWGRARPAQISAFGGDKRFTRAFVPSDQCVRNCSFPAGDPSVGFYLVSAGFLIAAPRRRRLAIAGAVTLGGVIGVVRIAQGGHFLSDVVAAGFLVYATSWLLHRWIVVDDGLTTLLRQLRRPPRALRLWALLALATTAAVAASIAWLDRPLADAVHARSATVDAVFRVITALGVSTGWLIAAAVAALGCGLAAARARDGERRRWLSLQAWRAGFVFITVAGAGLAGDVLKPVFGRARPSLWLADGIFGFTWHGARAAYWSFPSGHTITIVALAAALAQIERRGLPLYAAAALLVMASRVVLDGHYLSDVLAGAFLAGTACWAARAGFARAGVPLALSDSP